MTAISRVAIVAKPGAPTAAGTAHELAQQLEQAGCQVLLEGHIARELGAEVADAQRIADEAELVVVLGGDGTLIHAAGILHATEREVPILGVNLGSLGFMTEVPVADLRAVLDSVLQGQFAVERRIRLAVEVERGGRVVHTGGVINDVVINKGALARIVDLEARVDGRRLTTYKADGIIVSTPTGSTAYSLSANGPIVVPTLEAVLVTPICPHSLSQRSVVLPAASRIELQLTSSNGEVFLTLDGQSGLPMQQGDVVKLQKGPRPMLLVKNPHIDFFGLLRAKLRWGER
jgi:NAD+ kinase